MVYRVRLIVFLILWLPLLQGCPVLTVEIIYNNSGTDIVDGCIEWKDKTLLSLDSKLKNRLPVTHDKKGITSLFKIGHGGEWKVYEFEGLSDADEMKYRKPVRHSLENYQYHFQLEKDRNIYIISNNIVFPASSIETQPSGYPLKPKR